MCAAVAPCARRHWCLSLFIDDVWLFFRFCFLHKSRRGVQQNENIYSYFLVELDVWRDTGILFHLLNFCLVGRIFKVVQIGVYCCCCCIILLLCKRIFSHTDLFWLLLLFTFSEIHVNFVQIFRALYLSFIIMYFNSHCTTFT